MNLAQLKRGDWVRYVREDGIQFEARVEHVGIAHFRAAGYTFKRATGEAMRGSARVVAVVD